MRHLVALVACLCAIAYASSASAGVKTDGITYQGLLTDPASHPITDGPHDLILSLWSDSVGGAMLHSETVTVTTSNGLFTTCIGCASSSFAELFTDQSLFLQTQLSGQAAMTPRTRLRNVPFSNSASSLHGEAASGSARARGIIVVKPSGGTTQSALLLDADSDGDGHADFTVTDSASTSSASRVMSRDSDDDGVADNEISQSLTPTTCGVAIKTKGTGAEANRVLSIQTGATPTEVSSVSSIDDDGDTVPEGEISQSVTPTTCGVAIKHKGTGADHNRVLSIQTGATPTEVSSVSSIDDDGDTVPESELSQSVTPTTCGVAINTKGTGADKGRTISLTCNDSSALQTIDVDRNGDGVAEGSVSQSVTPTTCGVAIQTKGTGADKNRTVSSHCDDSSAVQVVEVDEDGDGHAEARAAVSSVSSLGGGGGGASSAAYARMTCDTDDDGIPDNEAAMTVTPTTCSVAIQTKGTGADKNRVIGSSDDTTATVLLATDSASISLKVRKGGTVTGSINVNSGSALRASMGSDGKGFFATGVGVGVDATHAVDVAGGAYCDGTNWVNASDIHAKENFEQVNGEELLNQISALEITRWNYKGDAKTGHIGPTAQNFKATFGVGSDGKSISTIDPSGIALAAIKELNKQNRELKQENATLKERLDALSQQVERLAASR